VSFVFLVDTHRQPLSPVHPGRARILLKAGKAAVLKRYPFTLILKAAIEQPQVQPLRIKLDPGSRTTGIAIVDDESGQVLFAAELAHLQHPGVHIGRVAVRAKGAFTISTNKGKVTDIGKKYCQVLQKADGYGYTQKGEAAFPSVP
jgi:RRXRR protein